MLKEDGRDKSEKEKKSTKKKKVKEREERGRGRKRKEEERDRVKAKNQLTDLLIRQVPLAAAGRDAAAFAAAAGRDAAATTGLAFDVVLIFEVVVVVPSVDGCQHLFTRSKKTSRVKVKSF